jgi:hypothetical protein
MLPALDFPMTIDLLASKQNPDGGWPYLRGASWTEPTVYSLLALLATGATGGVERGLRWILGTQRPDGSFPPHAGIDESSWTTALVALLPPERLGVAAHRRAVRWLLSSTGLESTKIYRVREWLLGNSRPVDQEFAGWPWITGTAAWVGPTSLSILALEKEARRNPSAEIASRITEGRNFLLNRMCQEGGWNHGSVHALGYESSPYPETTGMALAALRGVDNPQVRSAIDKALSFLGECRSADALNWLHMGLLAQGRMPADYTPPPDLAYRTVPESSLRLLIAEAKNGRDVWG